MIRSPTQRRTRVGDLLTAAKDDAQLTWLEVEQATGIRKPTREGWFRRSTRQPPLGPVLLLADYLGVDPARLVEAALADYKAAQVASGGGNGQPSRERAIQGVVEEASARKGGGGGRARRSQ